MSLLGQLLCFLNSSRFIDVEILRNIELSTSQSLDKLSAGHVKKSKVFPQIIMDLFSSHVEFTCANNVASV